LSLKIGSERTLELDDIFFVMKPEAALDRASLSIHIVVAKPTSSICRLYREGKTHHIVDGLS
jgi:hypothetical protein